MRQGMRAKLFWVLCVSALLTSPVLGVPSQSAASIESTPLGAASEPLPGDRAGSNNSGSAAFNLGDSLKTLLALGFVLGLAVAGAAGVKALSKGRGGLLGALGPGGPAPSGVLEILGRYPVGRGQTMILLRLDRRVLLLHQASGRKGESMRTLTELTDADEVASILLKTREEETERVDTGFREAMRRLETDFSAHERAGGSAQHEPAEQPNAAHEGDVVTLRSRLTRWAAGGAS